MMDGFVGRNVKITKKDNSFIKGCFVGVKDDFLEIKTLNDNVFLINLSEVKEVMIIHNGGKKSS